MIMVDDIKVNMKMNLRYLYKGVGNKYLNLEMYWYLVNGYDVRILFLLDMVRLYMKW